MNDKVKATYLLLLGNIYTILAVAHYNRNKVISKYGAYEFPLSISYEVKIGDIILHMKEEEYKIGKNDYMDKLVKEMFFNDIFKEIKLEQT